MRRGDVVDKLREGKAMRRSSVVVVSALLAMSLVGCRIDNKEKGPVTNSGGLGGDKSRTSGPQVIDVRSEAAKAYDEKMKRAQAGEVVDFSGNGYTYQTRTDANGVVYSESNGPPHAPSRSTSEMRPDGSYKSTYSANGDGIIDRQIERTPGREVIFYDRNRDGFFEERLTQEANYETGMILRTLETRNPGEEAWTIKEKGEFPPPHGEDIKKNTHERLDTTSTLSKAVESEWMADVLPGEASASDQVEWKLGHQIVVQGNSQGLPFDGKTQCSFDDLKKIQSALDSVMSKSMSCLEETNLNAANKLKDITKEGRQVRINCELRFNSPYDAVASTLNTPGWDSCKVGTPCNISIKRSYLRSPSTTEMSIQETLLHELLHVSGVPANAETHDNGNDEIYSCGRYCAGGSSAGTGAPSSNPKQDCERCAGANPTPKAKERCDKEKGPPTVRVRCSCNGKVYEVLKDCQDECKATIACFTGICHPVE